MSILRVARPAKTETEGAKLIEATMRLPDPLGIPTLFLDETDIGQPDEDNRFDALSQRLSCFIDSLPLNKDESTHLKQEFVSAGGHNAALRMILNQMQKGEGSPGHNLPSNARWFETDMPICSTISVRKDNLDANIMTGFFLGSGYLPPDHPLPASAEQWKYHVLWHEIGHNLGPSEPLAEIVASVMTRRAFDNPEFLTMLADINCISAILMAAGSQCHPRDIGSEGKQMREHLTRRGWQMVDVNDFVANMSLKALNALSEEQIKSFQFINLTPQIKPLINLGEYLLIEKFSQAAQHPIRCEVAEYMARRFSLAVERLREGRQAYKSEKMEKRVLPGGYKYFTMPEALPEFLLRP